MARLIFGMNMSLDGYVNHDKFAPDEELFQYFSDQAGTGAGSIYGRHLYEIMSYWDEDRPEWTPDRREYAEGWRRQRKWVVSRTLTSVGPNATLISENAESAVAKLKAELDGDLDIGGPELASSLSGLIDEYQIFLHPVVLGEGKPFFFAARPPLRLVDSQQIGNALKLTYVPA